MECRHSLSLSSVIGPPHSHFVNRPVVTETLIYAAVAISFTNDTQVVPIFAKVTCVNVPPFSNQRIIKNIAKFLCII